MRTALDAHDAVVCVFCFDDALLGGRHASGPRTQFLLESLHDLDASLRERGGGLVVRHGQPHRELVALAREVGAGEVHFSADVSPFARARGQRVAKALREAGIELHAHPGLAAVDDLGALSTGAGKPYSVFSPFHRTWQQCQRRAVQGAPRELPALPSKIAKGRIPSLASLGLEQEVAEPPPGGETAARERLRRFLDADVGEYAGNHDALGAERTSRLSPICTSAASRPARSRSASRAGSGPRPSGASCAGATSTTTCCCTSRPTRGRSFSRATAGRSAGAGRRRRSRRGARAGPAFRWWTPGCASCATRAGCTTAPGWWWARS